MQIRVRRYKCSGCGRIWRQGTTKAAPARAKISRGGLAWGLAGLVLDHLSVSRIAAGLGVSWSAANAAILTEGKRRLINDPHRFDGATTIGVDEHGWRHTRKGDKYVTVIIDLTPNRNGTGPARLLDMVEGRSKAVFKQWLVARPKQWRDVIEVVAMDGFAGFKTAAAEEVPDAVAVMDPFHVVRLAGDGLDRCRSESSSRASGIGAASGIRSRRPAAPCTPVTVSSPASNAIGSMHYSRLTSTSRSKRRGESISASSPHTESPRRIAGRP